MQQASLHPLLAMADAEPTKPPSEPPEPPPSSETTFSDDPLEHSNLAATFMVIILVTWLIFGHKIQGMFRWYAPPCMLRNRLVCKTLSHHGVTTADVSCTVSPVKTHAFVNDAELRQSC